MWCVPYESAQEEVVVEPLEHAASDGESDGDAGQVSEEARVRYQQLGDAQEQERHDPRRYVDAEDRPRDRHQQCVDRHPPEDDARVADGVRLALARAIEEPKQHPRPEEHQRLRTDQQDERVAQVGQRAEVVLDQAERPQA